MQVAFPAAFYDGQSSERHEVHVRFQEDTLLIEGADVGRLRFPLAMIKISPRVGNTPRFIQLTGGASLEVMENDAVDRLAPSLPGGRFHLAQYKLESKLRWILAMLALTLVFGWSTIQYGVPYLAKKVAFALPRDVDEALGEGALTSLDEFILRPTTLDAGERARLAEGFERMVALSDLDPERVKLEFRASPVLGPNAIALPSGIVIMTDELVRLAENEEEVLAVLAHEIGHIRHRHSLRGVLQNSTVALGIAGLTGDLGSLTSFSAALPTLLVELKYSRTFELEADDYAVDMLTKSGIEPSRLGDILLRMTEGMQEMPTYFSTHPHSIERAKRVE
jgi:Zn-dependent protease with chaperone function